ncbi:hypothetical protein P4E94_15325 [Pontiellaceae bacterium B12219]|nr:hypothetical protein [Pontiellaceae bacterium B12219]
MCKIEKYGTDLLPLVGKTIKLRKILIGSMVLGVAFGFVCSESDAANCAETCAGTTGWSQLQIPTSTPSLTIPTTEMWGEQETSSPGLTSPVYVGTIGVTQNINFSYGAPAGQPETAAGGDITAVTKTVSCTVATGSVSANAANFSFTASAQVTKSAAVDQETTYPGTACYKQKAYYFPERISGSNVYIKMVRQKKYSFLNATYYYDDFLTGDETKVITTQNTGGQGVDIIENCDADA